MTRTQLEYRKMRRLKVPATLLLIVLATVLFASMNMFSSSYVAHINDPGYDHWRALMINYAMVTALLGPIGLAVIASRQVDIEHQGNGWMQAGMAGTSHSQLCLAKIAALLPLVLLTILVEIGGLLLISRLRGCTRPLPVAEWCWYTAQVMVVSTVLLAFHVWISARWEPQLPALGLGVLGGFIGVYSLLMPPAFAHLVPWGYFSAALPVAATSHGSFTPRGYPVAAMSVFVAVAAALLTLAFHRLDTQEN